MQFNFACFLSYGSSFQTNDFVVFHCQNKKYLFLKDQWDITQNVQTRVIDIAHDQLTRAPIKCIEFHQSIVERFSNYRQDAKLRLN